MRFDYNSESSLLVDVETPKQVENALRHAKFMAQAFRVAPPTRGAYVVYQSPKGILLVQRAANSGFGANTWEFPGGKHEGEVRFEETAVDEFNQETDKLLNSQDLILEDVRITTDRLRQRLLFFVYFLSRGADFTPVLSDEHQNFQWVQPTDIASVNFMHPSLPYIVKRSTSLKSPSF